MKSRERRDEEAVTIVVGLLLFVLVAAGALCLVVCISSPVTPCPELSAYTT